MVTTYISYGLLVALAIALLFAAVTDIQRRQIDNWLNAGIAIAAPVFWWSSGLALWIEPNAFLQLLIIMAVAGGVLTIFMGLYHLFKRRKGRIAVPYGVAIAFGALWVLYPKLIAVPAFA